MTLLLLLVQLYASAQHKERTVFIYNVDLFGITPGIGDVINKPKQANWKKTFLKGFWQGDIAGLLNYAGKKTLYLVNRNQGDICAWPEKLLHAAGFL